MFALQARQSEVIKKEFNRETRPSFEDDWKEVRKK
jgi:hypothetical protein